MSYERLLGRRYLLRAQVRPKILYIGVATLFVGAICLWGSSALQAKINVVAEGSIGDLFADEFAAGAQLKQIGLVSQVVGLIMCTIGVCISLFGVLHRKIFR